MLGRPFQPLLRRQHVSRAEPLPAGAILAQRHQFGRGLHRAHRLAELIDVVAMAVNEPRQIMIGEGALLVGDRVQCDARLGDDRLAVAPGDLPMLKRAFGVLASSLAAQSGWTNLMLRLQVDALRLQRPMVDPHLDIELGQAGVHMVGPGLSPVGQKLGAIPRADLLTEAFAPDSVASDSTH